MVDFSSTEFSKAPKHTTPESAPGVRIDPGPFIGIVKNNVDPMRAGRVQVYIIEMGGDPEDQSSWRTVTYASPFFGVTPPPKNPNGKDVRPGGQAFESSPHSYGFWMTPPDVGVRVLCMFVNGDPFKGYWFACIPDWPNMSMVPGLSRPKGGPYVDYNEQPTEVQNIDQFFDRQVTPHTIIERQMTAQGILNDPLRGKITSSAFRESPSSVYGFSTPGRALKDPSNVADDDSGDIDRNVVGRRGGHSIILDDGDEKGNNQLMRFRTAGGNQIMMNDNCGFIHIIPASGNAWLELDATGNINIYGKGAFNVKVDGAMQFEAKSIGMKASTIDLFATSSLKGFGGTGVDFKAGGDLKLTGGKGAHVKGKDLYLSGDSCAYLNGKKGVDIKGGCITLNSGSGKPAQAAGQAQGVTGLPTREPWPGHKCGGASSSGLTGAVAALGAGALLYGASGGFGGTAKADTIAQPGFNASIKPIVGQDLPPP